MRLRFLADVTSATSGPGWRGGAGDVVLANPRYGVIVHGAVCNEAGELLYDLPVWSDPPNGAVIVPELPDGRLLFVEQFRPAAAAPGSVHPYPPEALDTLGAVSLELPRGFADPGEAQRDAARREAEEEIGYRVESLEHIGWCNPNTTFQTRAAGIFHALLGSSESERPADANETILARHPLTRSEALAAVRAGRIFCGFTLAALCAWLAQSEKNR